MARTFWQKTGFVAFSGVLLLSGAAMHAACEDPRARAAQKPEDLAEVLAKIDDVTITVGDFQNRLNQQSPYVRARYTSLERKKEFLDNLVRFEVLAEEAQKRGLDKDPEVIRTMKQVMIQKLLKNEFDKMSIKDVSDADVKQFFDSHPEQFSQPEERRASLILVKDQATAKKVLADARSRGTDNAAYRTLVAQYSIDMATKDRGGDLRYFDVNSHDVPKPIVDAVFKLGQVGDNSEPIRTAQGWAILKLTGNRKAITRTFDEVKEQIRNQLYRDKRQSTMQAFVEGLRSKAHVTIDEAKLAKVQVEGMTPSSFPGPGVPPPLPGQFHPGSLGVPGSSPMRPGAPAGARHLSLPRPSN